MENLSEMAAQLAENSLPASFGDDNDVVLTVPTRVAQSLVLFQAWLSSFSWRREKIHADRRNGQTSVSPPAKPGAYLTELPLEKIPIASISRVTGISEPWLQRYINRKYERVPHAIDRSKKGHLTVECDEM